MDCDSACECDCDWALELELALECCFADWVVFLPMPEAALCVFALHEFLEARLEPRLATRCWLWRRLRMASRRCMESGCLDMAGRSRASMLASAEAPAATTARVAATRVRNFMMDAMQKNNNETGVLSKNVALRVETMVV